MPQTNTNLTSPITNLRRALYLLDGLPATPESPHDYNCVRYDLLNAMVFAQHAIEELREERIRLYNERPRMFADEGVLP